MTPIRLFFFVIFAMSAFNGNTRTWFVSSTVAPSSVPSGQPSGYPSGQPTGQPSGVPSGQPTGEPSGQPSSIPSGEPSGQPSCVPSGQPSCVPSGQPSGVPSSQPTGEPSGTPSGQPSGEPSRMPSGEPSGQPSSVPSGQPSGQPSGEPSGQPTGEPSGIPSGQPSSIPSKIPTAVPSGQPSGQPTTSPSCVPSCIPSSEPSGQPSGWPSSQPSSLPSCVPSCLPSSLPSGQPTVQPTSVPSSEPSCRPSTVPSGQPSSEPSSQPSGVPSSLPTGQPSSQPSCVPSTMPTSAPSSYPTCLPSATPSSLPSSLPSGAPSGQPSSVPSSNPTSAPSLQQQILISYPAKSTIVGVTSETFTTQYQLAFQSSIASSISTNRRQLQNTDVTVDGVVNVAVTTRRLNGVLSQSLHNLIAPRAVYLGVRVSYTVSFVLENYGYLGKSGMAEAVSSITSQLHSASTNGSLSTAMKSVLLNSFGITPSPEFSVESFENDPSNIETTALKTYYPTSQPTERPGDNADGPSRVIQISIGTLLVICFAFFLAFYFRDESSFSDKIKIKKTKVSVTTADENSRSHLFSKADNEQRRLRDDTIRNVVATEEKALRSALENTELALPEALRARTFVEFISSNIFLRSHALLRIFSNTSRGISLSGVISLLSEGVTMFCVLTVIFFLRQSGSDILHDTRISTYDMFVLAYVTAVVLSPFFVLLNSMILWISVAGFSRLSTVVCEQKSLQKLDRGALGFDEEEGHGNSDRIVVGKSPLLEEVHRLQNRIEAFRENLVTDEVGNSLATTIYDDIFGRSVLSFGENNVWKAKSDIPENITSVFDTAWSIRTEHCSGSVAGVDELERRVSSKNERKIDIYSAFSQSIGMRDANEFLHEEVGESNELTPFQVLIQDLARARKIYDNEMKNCLGHDSSRTYSSLSSSELINIGQTVIRLFLLDVLPVCSATVLASLYKRQENFTLKPHMWSPSLLFYPVLLMAYLAGLITVAALFSTSLNEETQFIVLWCFVIWLSSSLIIVQPATIAVKNYVFSRTLSRDIKPSTSWIRSSLKDAAINNIKRCIAHNTESADESNNSSSPRTIAKQYIADMTSSKPLILGDAATFPPWALKNGIFFERNPAVEPNECNVVRSLPNISPIRSVMNRSDVLCDDQTYCVSLNASPFFFASNRVASRFSQLLESQVVLSFRTPWPKRMYGKPRKFDSILCQSRHHRELYPAQWHFFVLPSPLALAFVDGGFRVYIAEYVFMKARIMAGLVCSLPMCMQDIIIEMFVWGGLASAFLLHYHIAAVNVVFAVIPAVCVLAMCLLFMRRTCRPWEAENSWFAMNNLSRVQSDEITLDFNHIVRNIETKEQSRIEDENIVDMNMTNDLGPHSNDIRTSTRENGDSYLSSLSTPVKCDEKSVSENAAISTVRECEKSEVNTPEASPALPDFRTEVQKEVIKQLSLIFSSSNMDGSIGSPDVRRLPPLLRMDSNQKESSPVSSKDVRYASVRVARRNKSKDDDAVISSPSRSGKHVIMKSEIEAFMGKLLDGDSEHEELPSVNDFLEQASRHRKTGPVARKKGTGPQSPLPSNKEKHLTGGEEATPAINNSEDTTDKDSLFESHIVPESKTVHVHGCVEDNESKEGGTFANESK